MEIPITLRLSPSIHERLVRHAEAVGKPLDGYIADLLDVLSHDPPTMEQLSGEIGRRFAESGITEDELSEDLERAKHEMRQERRARRPA